jgi:hypothetical protein
VINLIFLAILACIGLAYFLFIRLCYHVIEGVCAEFVGPAIGF